MKPILFNTENVRAILEGTKTVTRRVVKFPRGWNPKFTGYIPDGAVLYGSNNIPAAKAPYKAGDILWVRETWRVHSATWSKADAKIEYKAGGQMEDVHFLCREDYDRFIFARPIGDGKWRSPYHMPREAARIFLRVTDVRVERLQEISYADVIAEGIPYGHAEYVKFKRIWEGTMKPADRAIYGWEANPWVWVIEVERIGKEEAE